MRKSVSAEEFLREWAAKLIAEEHRVNKLISNPDSSAFLFDLERLIADHLRGSAGEVVSEQPKHVTFTLAKRFWLIFHKTLREAVDGDEAKADSLIASFWVVHMIPILTEDFHVRARVEEKERPSSMRRAVISDREIPPRAD